MTFPDLLFLLFHWLVLIGGSALIVLGLLVEGRLADWLGYPKRSPKFHRLEIIGTWLIVAGVAWELAVTVNAEFEIAKARTESGIANRLAGEANERSQQLVRSNLLLAATVEELRSNNIILAAKLQPRTITLMQITNFIFLTEKIPKIPITVSTSTSGYEVESFAYQFREMLTKAKFGTPDNAGPWGINNVTTRLLAQQAGFPWESVSVYAVCYSTNDSQLWQIHSERTNGFNRPIVTNNDIGETYMAIRVVLSQIDIRRVFESMTSGAV